MIKVLIVDDHPIFRAGVATAVSAALDLDVIGEVGSASEALELVRDRQPDLILTDIQLQGDINGIGLAKRVRRQYPNIKIVVLTNYSHEPYIRAMMDCGVEGYLLKDISPSGLIASIRMILEGRSVFSVPISQKIVGDYLGVPGTSENSQANRISVRELEVLELLALGSSNTRIAERMHVSIATVQFHLTNIYSKFGVKTRLEAVVHASRHKLIVLDI